MSRVGVVTGYRAEARCLTPEQAEVVCSGVDPGRARAGAEKLVAGGAVGLVSFGLAGGLAPHLVAGDLVLPEAVILPDGRHVPTDVAWRNRLLALVEAHGLRAHAGTIAGSDRLVADSAAKRALFGACGAQAVDMESHVVATAARAGGRPFVVVRSIADPSGQAIPWAARSAIGADGEVRHLRVLGRLARRPSEIAALMSLGRSSSRGLATLRRVAALAPPGLCLV